MFLFAYAFPCFQTKLDKKLVQRKHVKLIMFQAWISVSVIGIGPKISVIGKFPSGALLALCHRKKLQTRGNNTDNYTESMIFIFKCIILCRIRAYNLVELFKFIVEDLEIYFQCKVLALAFGKLRTYTLQPDALIWQKCKYSWLKYNQTRQQWTIQISCTKQKTSRHNLHSELCNWNVLMSSWTRW